MNGCEKKKIEDEKEENKTKHDKFQSIKIYIF